MISSAAATGTAATTSTPWWVAPAVVASLITAVVAVATLIVNGRRARTDRHRNVFADAFGDIAAYREFVYIVRRRRHDEPEAERIRISTELSEVQRRLNHHRAVLTVEAPRVAKAFTALLATTRQIAGAAIREGWNKPPITTDADVHVDVDLSQMTPAEDAFLSAASDHLALAPWWLRSVGRALGIAPRWVWRQLLERGETQASKVAKEPVA